MYNVILDNEGYFVALGGSHPDDDFNEANKRHTMSHPPEHIPDIDSHSPAKVKSPKELKDKKEKDKVRVAFNRKATSETLGLLLFIFIFFRKANTCFSKGVCFLN